ncbi:type II toxin-antitoxin system Phd/YefM family antitoxin [Mycobacterium lacus]|nr:type II toxin-antitoxin system prevent-host-death family antitoxin [Mycobacterium lacus]
MTPVPADTGQRIELDELRKRAGCYFDRVTSGQMIEVVRRGKLVARIVSVAKNDARTSPIASASSRTRSPGCAASGHSPVQ